MALKFFELKMSCTACVSVKAWANQDKGGSKLMELEESNCKKLGRELHVSCSCKVLMLYDMVTLHSKVERTLRHGPVKDAIQMHMGNVGSSDYPCVSVFSLPVSSPCLCVCLVGSCTLLIMLIIQPLQYKNPSSSLMHHQIVPPYQW